MRLAERTDAGIDNLQWHLDSMKAKARPKTHHDGTIITQNENKHIVDSRFPAGDPRRIVAKTHRHLTAQGIPSGKYDPKSITMANGVRYVPLNDEHRLCDVCESGWMIPPWKRHYDTGYRPNIWLCLRAWLKIPAILFRERIRS